MATLLERSLTPDSDTGQAVVTQEIADACNTLIRNGWRIQRRGCCIIAAPPGRPIDRGSYVSLISLSECSDPLAYIKAAAL